MAPSGHCAVFSCSGFRGNNYDKSSKGAIFGPFRPFYYFSRLEISFAFLFQNDWLAWEVSYERKSFFSDVLSTGWQSTVWIRRGFMWRREILQNIPILNTGNIPLTTSNRQLQQVISERVGLSFNLAYFHTLGLIVQHKTFFF